MEENPLRKHELEVIALLSGMIRQYNEINSNTPLDEMHKLICKMADEILDVCEPKPSSVPQANELLPHISGRFSNDELERRADGCFLAITSYSPRNELGGIERKWIVKCIYKALKLVNDR